MALKKTLTDPLNWLLVVLAVAFTYYVVAVPYFTEFYLKTPQEMTLQEYLSNPSHPRPFMLHALSSPPSSIEIIVTDLTVTHIDQDSILLTADLSGADAGPMGEGDADDEAAQPVDDAVAPEDEADDMEPAEGETGEPGAEDTGAEDTEQEGEDDVFLDLQPEAPPPNNEILIAGDNLDLLPFSVGQRVSIRVHDLHETPLGWVVQEPQLDRSDEEFFTKEELDAMQTLGVITDGNEEVIPYVEVGELRFAPGVHPPGEPLTLAELDDDTDYIQTANRLEGGTVDLHGVRIAAKQFEDRTPYFLVEDDEGRRARAFFNPRLLSEWYWVLDRLGDDEAIVRGTLRQFTPGDLRALEADGNIQAVLDAFAILSTDGTKVFNLENPSE